MQFTYKSDFEKVSSKRPDGKPSNLYRKLLLREGTWTHPKLQQPITFTWDKLADLAKSFKEMASEGLKIPILSDHRWDEKGGNGWLRKIDHLGKPGESEIFGVLDLTDEAASRVDQGATQDVSVSIDDVQDCQSGKVWSEVIDELSLTLAPVITAQTGFVKLGEAVGFSYSRSKDSKRKDEGMPNDKEIDKEKVDLAKVQADLAKVQAENEALKAEKKAIETEKMDLAKRITSIESAQLEGAKRSIDLAITKAVEKGLKPKAAEHLKTLMGLDASIDLARASKTLDVLTDLLAEIEQSWPKGSTARTSVPDVEGGSDLSKMSVEDFMRKHGQLPTSK